MNKILIVLMLVIGTARAHAQDVSTMELKGSRDVLIKKFHSEGIVQPEDKRILFLREYIKKVPTGHFVILLQENSKEWTVLKDSFSRVRDGDIEVTIIDSVGPIQARIVLTYYPKGHKLRNLIFVGGVETSLLEKGNN